MKRKFKKGVKAYANLSVTIKSVDKEAKTLEAIFSSQSEDRHGDVILQDGWDLKMFKKNPVILNSHDYSDAAQVIGKASKLKIDGKNLTGKITFAVEENPKAKVIFDLYAGGFLNAFSVGFIPKEFKTDKDGKIDWFVISQAELLEVSAVSVPANALALAKKKGIDIDSLELKEIEGDEEEEEVTPPAEEEEEKEEVEEEEAPAGDEEKETIDDEEEVIEEEEEEAPAEETPQEKKIRLEKELGEVKKELGEEEDDDEGDDTIIEHTGKSHKKKVINAIKNIETKETRKLKQVARIVESMLDGDVEGVKMEKKVREQVRKRKVNQAIRTLFTLK